MSTWNVILCTVAMALISGPTLVCTKCLLKQHANDITPTYILHCSDMSEAQFMINAEQFSERKIDGLITRYINFTSLPKYSSWIQHIKFVEVRYNFEYINDTFIEDFRNINYFIINGGQSSHNVYRGFYLTTNDTIVDLIFENNNIGTILSLCSGDYFSVWRLSLSHNKIRSFTTLETGPYNCKTKLRGLDLKHNFLTTFNADVFLELPELQLIDLSYNQIAAFHNNISSLNNITINVKQLFLGNNNLSKLFNESFMFLSKLEMLSLNYNSLSNIPFNTLASLSQLKKLDLSYNVFYYLDSNVISGLTALEDLNIRGNRLLSFDLYNVNPRLQSLRHIDLSENQWVCEKLKSLIKYLSDEHIIYFYFEKNLFNDHIEGINCIKATVLKHVLNTEEKGEIYNSNSIIYILFGIISVMTVMVIIVVLLQVYCRWLKRRGVIDLEGREMRVRAPMRVEGLHYDYVEMSGVNQRQDITSGIYEEPPNFNVHTDRHDSAHAGGPGVASSSVSRPHVTGERDNNTTFVYDELASNHGPIYTKVID